MTTLTQEQVLEYLEQCNMLKLNALIKAIEERFDVTAQPLAMQTPVQSVEEPVEEKQTEFSVVVLEHGPERIKVIRAVKERTGLPLLECRNFVDDLPQAVEEGMSHEDAIDLQKIFEATGAKVEIQ